LTERKHSVLKTKSRNNKTEEKRKKKGRVKQKRGKNEKQGQKGEPSILSRLSKISPNGEIVEHSMTLDEQDKA